MDLIRKHGVSAAIVSSVLLSALMAVTENALVGSWGWALIAALLILVSCMACIQLLLHRATQREEATPSSVGDGGRAPAQSSVAGDPATFAISNSTVSRSVVAGRDVNQTRIGTGGLLGVVAVALLLGGGTTALGRTAAAVPRRALDRTPSSASAVPAVPAPTSTVAPTASSGTSGAYYSDSTTLVGGGKDLDPHDGTHGLADVSFSSKAGKGGLLLLNGAAFSILPDGRVPAPDTCRGATGYSSAMIAMPIDTQPIRCLRTSDGRYGSLSITAAETSALGGSAAITWTVWL